MSRPLFDDCLSSLLPFLGCGSPLPPPVDVSALACPSSALLLSGVLGARSLALSPRSLFGSSFGGLPCPPLRFCLACGPLRSEEPVWSAPRTACCLPDLDGGMSPRFLRPPCGAGVSRTVFPAVFPVVCCAMLFSDLQTISWGLAMFGGHCGPINKTDASPAKCRAFCHSTLGQYTCPRERGPAADRQAATARLWGSGIFSTRRLPTIERSIRNI